MCIYNDNAASHTWNYSSGRAESAVENAQFTHIYSSYGMMTSHHYAARRLNTDRGVPTTFVFWYYVSSRPPLMESRWCLIRRFAEITRYELSRDSRNIAHQTLHIRIRVHLYICSQHASIHFSVHYAIFVLRIISAGCFEIMQIALRKSSNIPSIADSTKNQIFLLIKFRR